MEFIKEFMLKNPEQTCVMCVAFFIATTVISCCFFNIVNSMFYDFMKRNKRD